MVAPSFQNMMQTCEPYKVGNKMYVKVRNPKTMNERQVRWYTEAEYATAFRPKEDNEVTLFGTHNLKDTLGFTEGYITIFPNAMDDSDEWFKRSEARYHVVWGWYFISNAWLPEDIPAAAGKPVRLLWNQISNADGSLKAPTAIRKFLDSILYDESPSRFQGEIGDRLERKLTIVKIAKFDSAYGNGVGYIYTFEDESENVYIWKTSAKVLELDVEYKVRGTVKEFKTEKGVQKTILTRCYIN